MVDYQTGSDDRSIDLPAPERVLTVGAHPDDAEFGAGGTLAKWAAAGAEITMLILTDGSKGTWDPSLDPEALAAARVSEQRAAAETLGAAGVVMLGHTDGELEYTMALREEVCFHIRRTKPDVVLGHDPWRRYMLHPDHRAAGWAVVDGVVAARDHLFFTDQLRDGLSHHRPSSLLLWAADETDHWESIDGHVQTKTQALLSHSTQTVTTMDGAGSSDEATSTFTAAIEDRAAATGAAVGLSFAEAFKRITP